MFYRFALATVAVLVVGCSDPKAANEKNFKIAIQNAIDTEYPRCYIKENFPATIPAFGGANQKAIFKALVTAGLLSEKDEPHEIKQYFGKSKVVIEPTFYLTEEGKKSYKADAAKDYTGKTTGGFCFGKATVKDIPQFTEPSESAGMRVSQVKFTYQVSDFPAWAKLPEMLSAIAVLKRDVESEKVPIDGEAVLKLTNNGWVNAMK